MIEQQDLVNVLENIKLKGDKVISIATCGILFHECMKPIYSSFLNKPEKYTLKQKQKHVTNLIQHIYHVPIGKYIKPDDPKDLPVTRKRFNLWSVFARMWR